MGTPKTHHLTAERAREVLEYDPETGRFTWKVSRPGCTAGTEAGTPSRGYRVIEIDYVLYRAHRVAFLMMTGRWPAGPMDHRNRKRSDNRWENLRESTPSQNARNRSASGKSGVLGVYQVGAKWSAEIWLDGRNVRLGRFADIAEATEARQQAERLHFGEFAPSIVPDLEDMTGGQS